MTWDETNIRWTDYTWNPVHGCSKTGSPGCANCYAERVSRRFNNTDKPWLPENASDNVQIKDHKLKELDSLPDPCWVFVNSMSDLFHEEVPNTFIRAVMDHIKQHPNSAFQVLTKHAPDNDRMTPFLPHNVMLGVSVGHSGWKHRIDWLRKQNVYTRFVSFEPLVGLIEDVDLSGVDWAIIGGESGPDHRSMEPEWVRVLIESCRNQDASVFFKQHSGDRPEEKITFDGDRIEEFPVLPDNVVPRPREFMRDMEVGVCGE